MRKRFKRVGAAVLSLAMIVGVMSAVTKPIEVQAANSAPGAACWTDADGLGSFGMSSSDTTIAKIRFGLNGSDAREWAICGKDGNDLALLSTTGFANAAYGSNSKYSTSNFVTDIKKYVSNSNNTSTYLGSTYFNKSSPKKCVNCSQLKMILSCRLLGHLFDDLFMIVVVGKHIEHTAACAPFIMLIDQD